MKEVKKVWSSPEVKKLKIKSYTAEIIIHNKEHSPNFS